MDIEQIREGLVMFGVAPWENGFPEHEYDYGLNGYVGMGSMTEKRMKRCRR